MSHSANQKQIITGRFGAMGVSTSYCEKAEALYTNKCKSIHCVLWFTSAWCFPRMG